MDPLKITKIKRAILILASIWIGAIAIWIFKDALTSNIFEGKSFDEISILNKLILLSISLPLCYVIILNLVEYLFPDNLLEWFLHLIKTTTSIDLEKNKDLLISNNHQSRSILLNAFSIVFLSIFLLVMSEWVFLFTKESYMSGMVFFEKADILFQSAWIPSVIIYFIIFIIWVFSNTINLPIIHKIAMFFYRLIPAIILAITAILVFDNFTYIIFGVGIVDSYSVFRASYGLGFILFVNKTYTKIQIQDCSRKLNPGWNIISIVAVVLFGLGTVSTIIGILSEKPQMFNKPNQIASKKPNIILIGSDGVTTENLPMYGYERDTTPFITSIVDQALVANSNYAETGSSWGSLISIMTGKLPTRTKVVNMPDVLMGDESYQHLPGELKKLGYSNIDINYEIYSDVSQANVRNGFDLINNVPVNSNILASSLGKILPVNSQYNLDLLMERASDRLQHIFFLRIMTNHYKEVNSLTGRKDATSRIPALMNYVQDGEEPFFIHIHLMGTHGPYYKTNSTTYSQGRKQKNEFEVDFYDDAITDFDTYVHNLFSLLETTDRLNHTVVIIYSDHPRKRSAYQNTPLLFWFPEGEFAKTIYANTQNIDIAPTILDYIGVSIPEWMEGESLIGKDPIPTRPIFSVIWKNPKKNRPENQDFLQFGSFRMIICDQYVEYSALKLKWETGEVEDKNGVCSEDQIVSAEKMKNMLILRLQQDGFKTTLLEETR